MTRTQLERKYEELGLTDYQLCNLEQLSEIHNVGVNEINGYKQLSDEHKELFNEAIINFYNAWGLDNRKTLKPKSVNYVCEVNYYKKIEDTDDFFTDIGQEIYVLDDDGRTVSRRLHEYIFEKGIDLKFCEKNTKIYLRFELSDEWYHIISPIQWY